MSVKGFLLSLLISISPVTLLANGTIEQQPPPTLVLSEAVWPCFPELFKNKLRSHYFYLENKRSTKLQFVPSNDVNLLATKEYLESCKKYYSLIEVESRENGKYISLQVRKARAEVIAFQAFAAIYQKLYQLEHENTRLFRALLAAMDIASLGIRVSSFCTENLVYQQSYCTPKKILKTMIETKNQFERAIEEYQKTDQLVQIRVEMTKDAQVLLSELNDAIASFGGNKK